MSDVVNILEAANTESKELSRYQMFLLAKISDLYQQLERSASLNDCFLGFAILGKLTDLEEMLLSTGISRLQISTFVNTARDKESVELVEGA